MSLISKIYDPLGLDIPYLLKGKRILQESCKRNYSWDDAIADDYIAETNGEMEVENLKKERCFKPSKLIHCSLHHFFGVSQNGYGHVLYLR